MKNKTVLFFLYIFCQSSTVFSQNNTTISFKPMFGTIDIVNKDSLIQLRDSDNLQIENLKFYISNIQFFKKGKLVFEEKNSIHLIDIHNSQSLNIELKNKCDFDLLKFNIGIDSLLNVSGAMGGDLDPTKGMYWTWQSGYINFKLEGRSDFFNSRNHVFEFHLGGYAQPYNCLQTVSLSVFNTEKINLILDLEKVFNQIDLKSQHNIMSPSNDAIKLSNIVAKAFRVVEK